jgi:hypothetical protein
MGDPTPPTVVDRDIREQVGWLAYTHYGWLIDSGQWARIAEDIFAEDAIQDLGSGMVRHGRPEIHEGFADAVSKLEGTAHYFTNVHAEVTGDGAATSRAYLQTWHWTTETADAGPSRNADFIGVGVYHDDLRLLPEGWRIVHRRRRMLGPSPLGLGALPPIFAQRMAGWGEDDSG